MNLEGASGARDRQYPQADLGSQSSYNQMNRRSYPFGVETSQKQFNPSQTKNQAGISGIEKDQLASAKRPYPEDQRFSTNISPKQNLNQNNILRTPVNQTGELDNIELKPDVSAFNSSDAVKSPAEGTWTLGGGQKYQTVGSLSNVKAQGIQGMNPQGGN